MDDQLYCNLINCFKVFFVGPTRQEEEGARFASEGGPIDALKRSEVRRSKGEGATVEQDDTSAFVNFPQASAVGAFLVPREEFAMLIDAAEFKDAILVDDKLLVHKVMRFQGEEVMRGLAGCRSLGLLKSLRSLGSIKSLTSCAGIS